MEYKLFRVLITMTTVILKNVGTDEVITIDNPATYLDTGLEVAANHLFQQGRELVGQPFPVPRTNFTSQSNVPQWEYFLLTVPIAPAP